MDLVECRLPLRAECLERLENWLEENEALAWNIYEDVEQDQAWLSGVFASRTEAEAEWRRLRTGAALDGDPEWGTIARADWRESYREHFKAWNYEGLHWVPEWERAHYALPAGEQAVWLDPGMAFGTGNHETTRLCAERLVRLTRRQPDGNLSSLSVIDAGCGSGILAISAAKLGARSVYAFDIDEEAVAVSRRNASVNGEGDRIVFIRGDLVSGLNRRRADVVLANIQADVLCRGAADLVRSVRAGGILILSGILGAELETVRESFARAAPDAVFDSKVMGEWADLQLTFR